MTSNCCYLARKLLTFLLYFEMKIMRDPPPLLLPYNSTKRRKILPIYLSIFNER